MDMMEYLRKYGAEVKNRVMNPGQTIAAALKEGMPTEQNPLGMFGFGGITKFGRQPKRIPVEEPTKELLDHSLRANDWQSVTLPDKTPLYKLKDGAWADDTGKVVFEDTQHMFDSLRDLRMAMETKQNTMINPAIVPNSPQVMRSNRPSSPFYKDPFMDTTK